jgi:uncharacterized protein RhaS with RHS repeats
MGRWLSRDLIDENGGLNLYGFVGNNPMDYYDPYGLFSVSGFGSGLISIVVETIKMGSDLLVVTMIACNNAASKNQMFAEDTSSMSFLAPTPLPSWQTPERAKDKVSSRVPALGRKTNEVAAGFWPGRQASPKEPPDRG